MPLFVVDDKIVKLDIDAFALPYCKELKEYYQKNKIYSKSLYDIYKKSLSKEIKNDRQKDIFNSHKLYELYEDIVDKDRVNYLYEQEKLLKAKFEKIDRIRKKIDIKYKKLLNPLNFEEASLITLSFRLGSRDRIYRDYSIFANLSKEELYKKRFLYNEYKNKINVFNEYYKKTEQQLNIIKEAIINIESNKNKTVITLNNIKINKKSRISYKNNNNIIELNAYYEKLIEYAQANKISKIAIPIIDFYNMPDRNYYIEMARDYIRDGIDRAKDDITVYLLLTDSNNDYCQDSELVNIYEKISSLLENNVDIKEIDFNAKRLFKIFSKYLTSELKTKSKKEDYLEFYYYRLLELKKGNSHYDLDDFYSNKREKKIENVEKLKYFDVKAFWERINRFKNTEFELDFDSIDKKIENNKKILKKLGEDIKSCLAEKELEEKSIFLCERGSSKSENLQKEIQSLIEAKKESFSQMVLRIIKKTHRDNVACYKAANVNKNIFSKILKDANCDENKDGTAYVYNPDKKIALAFSIALRLKLNEAEELLQKAGYAFSDSSQDIIVKTFIQKGIYDIDLVNQFLFRFNQPLLGSTARE